MFKIVLGNPEELVPSNFKPDSKAAESDPCKFPVDKLTFRETTRGITVSFPLEAQEEIFGFGLQLKGFACKHTKKLLRSNADPVANTGDSHSPVPFFVSTGGYGVCVDTLRNAAFYCGYKKGRGEVSRENRINDTTAELYGTRYQEGSSQMLIDIPAAKGVTLYVFEGENITDVVSEYNMFSGGGCIPPLWGLGLTYRCYTKFNMDQIVDTARYFRENNIPLSCLGLEPGWQTHAYSCTFNVNPELYPDFQGMVKKLRDMDIQLNLWEHAFTHPDSPIYNELKDCSGDIPVWDGHVPDFATEKAKSVFAGYHKKAFVDIGVNGYKLDECDGSDYTGSWTYPDCSTFPSGLDGEQMHNIFGILYQQTMLKALDGNETYSQVRNSGAFACSYPFVLYSDLYDHKDFIRGVCTSGLSGILWTPELREGKNKTDLIRRLQTLVFSAQCLINAWYIDGLPWESLSCTDEVRELINLRMSLIPYLLSAFYKYNKQGKAPVRPLVADFTQDKNTYNCDNEYLLGDSLLVAPMTAEESQRDVYLPDGVWHDFWTGKIYSGGTYTFETENIPVFVKDNTLFPLARPTAFAADDTVFELELKSYGAPKGFTLIEKQGSSCMEIEITPDTRGPVGKNYIII